MSECQAVVSQVGPDARLIELSGDVDVASSPGMEKLLNDLIEDGVRNFILDLRGVGFLNTAGTVVLVHALQRVRPRNGKITVICTNSKVCKFFAITRLDRVFTVCTSRDEAMQTLRDAA